MDNKPDSTYMSILKIVPADDDNGKKAYPILKFFGNAAPLRREALVPHEQKRKTRSVNTAVNEETRSKRVHKVQKF